MHRQATEKQDLLIFISDQHSPLFEKSRQGVVDTPSLDRLRAEGVSFEEAYTTCPLCVPARMSMLSGLLPSETGILTNKDTLADTTPTFLHALAAEGYETVLIGRMHFIGRDQRHGFTRRLAKDITSTNWAGKKEELDRERGVFHNCFGVPGCTNVTGGGESPVQYYDDMVVDQALDYLSQDHEKPQCIVVGTYAPHFPYAAPENLYRKYREKAELPLFFKEEPPYEMNPALKSRQKQVSEETALEAVAAYCGLVEFTDALIGKVYDAFREYKKRYGKKGSFIYLSDHGDQVGERRIYGKSTFFEKSAKIPLIFAGDGIDRGRKEKTLASLLDLAPTVCAMAGAGGAEEWKGTDLTEYLTGGREGQDRTVVSQVMGEDGSGRHYGTMVRWRQYKYISYHGYEDQDLLFDLEKDPQETDNLRGTLPEVEKQLKACLPSKEEAGRIENVQRLHDRNASWFKAYETVTGADNGEHWGDVPESAKQYPKVH